MTTWFAVTCPTCGYGMQGHSAIGDEDAVPGEGDYSLCIACGSIAVYQRVLATMTLRVPTDAEREQALCDPQVVAAMLAQRQGRAIYPDWPRGPKEVT